MKKFELMKWVGWTSVVQTIHTEFVLKGTLMDIVNYAKTNGLTWHELPNHLVGGYYTKSIDSHTADAYEVVPCGGGA